MSCVSDRCSQLSAVKTQLRRWLGLLKKNDKHEFDDVQGWYKKRFCLRVTREEQDEGG